MRPLNDWHDCIVPGCPNKCCLALDSEKCFPHTPGNDHVKGWRIDASNALSRTPAPAMNSYDRLVHASDCDANR